MGQKLMIDGLEATNTANKASNVLMDSGKTVQTELDEINQNLNYKQTKGERIETDGNLAIAPSTNAFANAPIVINAPASSTDARAGIGFHNAGVVGAYLYLNNDQGLLHFIRHDGVDFRIETSISNDISLTQRMTASDGLKFRFATDGEGNYGYLGADDSFIPFKSGGKLVNLGTRSLNPAANARDISTTYDCTSIKGYNTKTADDFIVTIDTTKTMVYLNGQGGGWAYSSFDLHTEKSYDASTGILTVTLYSAYFHNGSTIMNNSGTVVSVWTVG